MLDSLLYRDVCKRWNRGRSAELDFTSDGSRLYKSQRVEVLLQDLFLERALGESSCAEHGQ